MWEIFDFTSHIYQFSILAEALDDALEYTQVNPQVRRRASEDVM